MIKNFTYTKPGNLDEVTSELNGSVDAKIIAGGTDILGVINEKIKASCPERLVSLKGSKLDYIKEEEGVLKVGSMTTLSSIEDSEIIKEKYPVLWQAAHKVAAKQIRHMATLGGNICQEPRCWYYRYQGNKFDCMRKGGKLCNAMMGENIYHSVFGGVKVCESPCEAQCPNETSIPEYFDLIRKGDIDGAAGILWEMNPLAAVVGRVCPHTCQSKCNRDEYDQEVSIRNIERTMGDYMLDNAEKFVSPPEKESGRKIAIIGAGPAGLTAAFFLRKEGHDVTVYDANKKAGGMLRYGIPSYRLPRTILDRLVEIFSDTGIKFIQNYAIEKDSTVKDLCEKNDAVFVAVGAWKSVPVGCKGDDALGVEGGIDFLYKASNQEETGVEGKIVAVVGGGNTAMDCCRTAKRLGAKAVYNFYRRTEDEMPAEKDEIEEAKKEGIEFIYLVSPAEIIEKDGAVSEVKLQKMELGEADESGRRRPIPIDNSFETVKIDILLSAIGQSVNAENLGLETNEKMWIKVDDDRHMTSREKVFAAGDAAIGPKTAIEAIADARKTANQINLYLGGGTILREKKIHHQLSFDSSCMEESKALVLNEIEPMERTLEKEDISSASIDEIRKEANRCYNCGCVAVSPSDTAPALITLDSVIITSKRQIPAAEFFSAGEGTSTVLEKDEVVKEICIQENRAGSFQSYEKFRTRETIDFPIAGLAANINIKDGVISSAKLVFSGVAPVPYELYEVEDYLTGKEPSEKLAEEAGNIAIKRVKVLKDNKFKVQIIKAYIRRAVIESAKSL